MIYSILAHCYQQARSFFYIALLITSTNQARNPRRTIDPLVPIITVSSTNPKISRSWASHSCKDNRKTYTIKSNFLRLKPLKHGFDIDFFQKHYIPNSIIRFRDNTGVVSGTTLAQLASELIEEIKKKQRTFTHFEILKDTDFNYKSLSGLIVLRYKNYPFVIKVSIEHPHSIVQPYAKNNITTLGMFIVGGNLRHLSNFTRITNLHKIKEILNSNPFYLHSIDFPRKWYWKPENNYDLQIDWKSKDHQETIFLPSIYATISDFIYTEEQQPQNELNKLSMKIATDVGFLIDPHAGNILIEKNTRKYILLDTEDFRLMTGLSTTMKAKKYIGWYIELITNATSTLLFRSKQERQRQSMLL